MEARTLANLILETCAKRINGEPADVVITLYDESTGLKMVGWDIQYVLPGEGLYTGDPTLEIVCRAGSKSDAESNEVREEMRDYSKARLRLALVGLVISCAALAASVAALVIR